MREMIESMVDEILDQEGDIVIAGSVFSRSAIYREMDPTGYRIACVDMADSLIEDLQSEMECLDPELDADEVADIKERIEMLESLQ